MQRALPFSIGNPGEDVPTIDVADLKSLWSIYRDMETRNVGVGIRIIRDACSAGADIGAVLYRGSMIEVLEICPGASQEPIRYHEVAKPWEIAWGFSLTIKLLALSDVLRRNVLPSSKVSK